MNFFKDYEAFCEIIRHNPHFSKLRFFNTNFKLLAQFFEKLEQFKIENEKNVFSSFTIKELHIWHVIHSFPAKLIAVWENWIFKPPCLAMRKSNFWSFMVFFSCPFFSFKFCLVVGYDIVLQIASQLRDKWLESSTRGCSLNAKL